MCIPLLIKSGSTRAISLSRRLPETVGSDVQKVGNGDMFTSVSAARLARAGSLASAAGVPVPLASFRRFSYVREFVEIRRQHD